MQEMIRRVGLAKAALDNGFSRVGPGLSREQDAEGTLLREAGRVAALSNAAALLCNGGHAAAAVYLLRPMREAALSMGRRAGLAERPSAPDAPRLEALERARDGALAAGLPWAHVFADEQATVRPEGVLGAALASLRLALEALADRWPEAFRVPEEI